MEYEGTSIIAIIDDDEDVGDVLGGLLEAMGYYYKVYSSASHFFSEANFSQLACLIVDQNMPQMTGLQMIERLIQQGVEIPALLITGTHDTIIEHNAARLGVMTVLEKPMSHHELLNFVSMSIG